MSPDRPSPQSRPEVQSLSCPSCGAPIALRSLGQAVAVVCEHCHTILDAKDPQLAILQKFKALVDEDPPLIPLGTRGSIRGTTYEVIGFERRSIRVEGISYSWHEYVLFNPYKGFRYLTEYNGHWNDTSVLRMLPTIDKSNPLELNYLDETYKRFQTAEAKTSFVLGEFPWRVRVGESVEVSDYVSPPRVISREGSGSEMTWSMGEYLSGQDVWSAFGLPGAPPERIGVYENQPSPLSAATQAVWILFMVFLFVLLVMSGGLAGIAAGTVVYVGDYDFNTSSSSEASFVTGVFPIEGRTSNVEIDTSSSLDNNWIYLNYSLINQDTGQAYDVGREISYYHGYDSDGYWSEGKRDDSVIVASVPSGNYYLRIEPESDPGHGSILYSVKLKRDVFQFSFVAIALLALLVPPLLITWRSLNFEHLRWAESDYAPSSDDDDGDGASFKKWFEIGTPR